MRVSECARVRHIRPQSEPNPRLRAPPPFSGAPGAGGPVAVGCAGGLGWGGAKFSIFQFSCSMAQKLDTGSDNHGKTNRTSRSGGFAEFRPIPGRLWGGPDALVRCPTQCTLADAWPSEPTPRGAAPRRRSPPRSHRRIRLLTAARLTAAARPTRRNCAAASASLENERAARATVRSRAQRRRAKPAGRSSA